MCIRDSFNIYERSFDVNYYGALRLVKSVLPYMQAQKYGKVIFTSSGVGAVSYTHLDVYKRQV